MKTRDKAITFTVIAFGGYLLYTIVYMKQSNESLQVQGNLLQEFQTQEADIRTYLLKPHEILKNLTNKNRSYSRAKQDKVAYDILRKKTAFFVEISAHGGQFPSNTLWLERQHDWTGLLIEANPELCQQIDKLKRHAWRLCACLSSSHKSVTFIKGGGVGGVEDHIDDHHMKMLDQKNKITVPCFSLEHVLDVIGVHHIDFYSLDVEGAETAILKSLQHGLVKRTFTVDVWSIKYRQKSFKQITLEKSKENLYALRRFFNELGGFFEYTQLSTDTNTADGYALDVVFVSTNTWCKIWDFFPNGTQCVGKERRFRIRKYLLSPHPYRAVKNVDKKYSQAKQDEVAYDIIQKKNGFFVEIGAFDGQSLSNTLWLERKHNWTGLLIEANPQLCQKIDKLKRHSWRMCACLSDTLDRVVFIKGDKVGGIEGQVNTHHVKMLYRKPKTTVPCFSLEAALEEIKTNHIDFFSLDVEGAEMTTLESLRKGLVSKRFTVDVWSIEYRVWDGQKIVFENSLANLNALRKFFQDIGGYSEHSQVTTEDEPIPSDGKALDVIFVKNDMFCKTHDKLPNGTRCSP